MDKKLLNILISSLSFPIFLIHPQSLEFQKNH